MKKEEREDFRIMYPHDKRPGLIMREERLDVIDISRRAIRFSLGTTLRATITFQDGESLNIEGAILRCQENEIIVKLSKDMPSERIFKEHLLVK